MKNYDDFVKKASLKGFVKKVSGRALKEARQEALNKYKTLIKPYVKANAKARRNANIARELYDNASDIYGSAVRQHSKALRRNPELKEKIIRFADISKAAHKEKNVFERDMLNAMWEQTRASEALRDARRQGKKAYSSAIENASNELKKSRDQLAKGIGVGTIAAATAIGTGIAAKKLRDKHNQEEDAFSKSAQIESPSPAEKEHMSEEERYLDAPVAEKSEKHAEKKRGLSKKDRDKILRMLNLKRAEK